METQTMSDQSQSNFGRAVCNAVCTAVLTAEGVDPDAVREAVDDELRAEFDRRVGDLYAAVEHAKESDHVDADTQFALEQDLQAARDAESDLFPAGQSRVNRALEARANTVRVVPHAFDPTQMTCCLDPARFTVATGELMWTALSVKDDDEGLASDLYPVFLTANGVHCGGPDKNHNDAFPVCKHEITVLLQLAADFCTTDKTVSDDETSLEAVVAHGRDRLDAVDASAMVDDAPSPLAMLAGGDGDSRS